MTQHDKNKTRIKFKPIINVSTVRARHKTCVEISVPRIYTFCPRYTYVLYCMDVVHGFNNYTKIPYNTKFIFCFNQRITSTCCDINSSDCILSINDNYGKSSVKQQQKPCFWRFQKATSYIARFFIRT